MTLDDEYHRYVHGDSAGGCGLGAEISLQWEGWYTCMYIRTVGILKRGGIRSREKLMVADIRPSSEPDFLSRSAFGEGNNSLLI